MKTLSTALSIELTTDRLAVYWDALCDLPIEWVTWACQYATRHWHPTPQEWRFPIPATLRDYARHYREEQMRQTAAAARAMLPQWSSTPDEEGLAAIRNILTKLGDNMEMTHPVYQAPSTDDPDKRRAELLEQARLILRQSETSGENPYAN